MTPKVKVPWWKWLIIAACSLVLIYMIQGCSALSGGFDVQAEDLVGFYFETPKQEYYLTFITLDTAEYFDGSRKSGSFTCVDGSIELKDGEELYHFVALGDNRIFDSGLKKIFYKE